MLQEAPNARHLVRPGFSRYANAVSTCAQAMPQWLGGHIKAELSDSSFLGLVFDTRIALFTVYLPDVGKSEHLYERALEELSAGLLVAKNHYSACGRLGC